MIIGKEIAGDVSFDKKLTGFVENGYLTDSHRGNLNSALEAGHATIHRGHIPKIKDAERVAEIVYHLLVSVYGNQHKEKLDQSTPKREKKK